LYYLILILKDIKLDHQDFSNFKNTHKIYIFFPC
jgi:hypothetical protein